MIRVTGVYKGGIPYSVSFILTRLQWNQSVKILPHVMTLFRVCLLPLVVITWNQGPREVSLGVFLLVILSDLLDGHLARKLGTASTTGAYLDVMADFVVILGMFSMFVIQGLYPFWVILLIVLMFAQFMLTSIGLTRVIYDPIGKYFGAFLFGVIGITLLVPDMLVCVALSVGILCMTAASLISRVIRLCDMFKALRVTILTALLRIE